MPIQPKSPTVADRSDISDALRELGQGLVEQLPVVPREAGAGPPPAAEIQLAMTDLVSDGNNEVVIYNDSGFRTLAITTEAAVVASGQSGAHVTEAGEDVSGYRFVTFDNGMTLYYQEGLDLITQPGTA